MWDAWGGTSGVEWAIKKLDQIDAKNEIYYDHTYHFTKEQMNELHEKGVLYVKQTRRRKRNDNKIYILKNK